LALILTASAQGATISFMVIETGLKEEIPTIGSSKLWEDALLGVFFDTGHIVSNTPILRIPEKPLQDLPDEAKRPFDEALAGGMDFFVIALLDYKNPSQIGQPVKPRAISLRLFRTRPYKFLFTQEYSEEALLKVADERTNAASAARIIAAHLQDK
jgi:hypothetical protein